MKDKIICNKIVKLLNARFTRLFFLSICMLSLPNISGAAIIIEKDHQSTKIQYEEYKVFVDTSLSMTFNEIKENKEAFSMNYGKTIRNQNANNWFVFDLYNLGDKESFILEFFDPHINDIEIFVTESDSIVDYHFSPEGYSFDFNKKVIQHKNQVFDLILHNRIKYTVFVRISSLSNASLSARLSTGRYFTNYALGEYFYLGMFYGVIFIMVIYHIFIYTSLDEKSYLYFVFYLISGVLITFYEDGMGFQFIWPHMPSFNMWLPYFFRLFLPLAFYFYYSELIELKENYPFLRKLLLYMVVFIMVIELGLGIFDVSSRFYTFSLLFLFATTLISSLYLIINLNYKPAYYLLFGNSILFANFLMLLLRSYKIIPSNIITVYSFNFSFVIEAVIFAVALGEKMRETKDSEISALKIAKSSKDKINRELEYLVDERTSKVIEQKNTLEVYNQHLVDSLGYAKRIQEMIFPLKSVFAKNFNDFCVLNLPLNVVSGDFYWFYEITSEEIIVISGECTSGGVPGAFMSMILNTELNSLIKEQQVYNPSQILGILNKRIFELVHMDRSGQIQNDEKLSISVCRINKSYKQIDMASANRSVFFIKNDLIDEIKGSRNLLGSAEAQKAIFETIHRSYAHNELMYMVSDGFARQKGGPSQIEYSVERLKEKLLSVNKLSLSIQEEILTTEFHNWHNGVSQDDDVLLIGLRF